MKTKIGSAILLLFLMACSSSEQKPQTDNQTVVTNPLAQITKFCLKASNNMYVQIGPDSILAADQPDINKAAVFEKADNGNDNYSMKASNGKFVSDDRNRSNNLVANRDYAGAWEMFQLLSIDQTKINIKSSMGKFVCADQNKGNKLFADRDAAASWETFVMEPR